MSRGRGRDETANLQHARLGFHCATSPSSVNQVHAIDCINADLDRLARFYLLLTRPPGDPDVAGLVDMYGAADAAEFVSATYSDWEKEADAAYEECRTRGLRFLVPGDEEWPALLATAVRPPLGLWVLGDGHLGKLTRRAVGIVGRAEPTRYGVWLAAELGCRLARAGWTVMTLGRIGVDSTALRGALQDEVRPFDPRWDGAPPVVLPLGPMLDPEPPANRHLFRRVGRDGILADEHGANMPERHRRQKVRRQLRLLAALVSSVIAVEPNGRAGTAVSSGRPRTPTCRF